MVARKIETIEEPDDRRSVDRYGYSGFFQVNYVIYYILGIIEALLLLRFLFKALGANTGSGFVDWIYTITNGLVAPFNGIFPTGTTSGLANMSVIEPSTIVAMIVYAIIAWAITALLSALFASRD